MRSGVGTCAEGRKQPSGTSADHARRLTRGLRTRPEEQQVRGRRPLSGAPACNNGGGGHSEAWACHPSALGCLCLGKWLQEGLTAHSGPRRMFIFQSQQIVLLEPLTPSLRNYAPLSPLNDSFQHLLCHLMGGRGRNALQQAPWLFRARQRPRFQAWFSPGWQTLGPRRNSASLHAGAPFKRQPVFRAGHQSCFWVAFFCLFSFLNVVFNQICL